MSNRRNRNRSEVIYLPGPSVKPAVAAFGLLGILAGTFMGWPYLVAGAVLFIPAVIGWIVDARRDYAERPREQAVTTAVVPPLVDRESAGSTK